MTPSAQSQLVYMTADPSVPFERRAGGLLINAPSIVAVGSCLNEAMKEGRGAGVEGVVAALVGMTNALFLLVFGGVSRGADTQENDKTGDEPE